MRNRDYYTSYYWPYVGATLAEEPGRNTANIRQSLRATAISNVQRYFRGSERNFGYRLTEYGPELVIFDNNGAMMKWWQDQMGNHRIWYMALFQITDPQAILPSHERLQNRPDDWVSKF